MEFSLWEYGFISLASCACSFINAVAGGGILVLYPALTAVGVPPVAAVANLKIGLFPGSVGAMFAQRDLLIGQKINLFATALAAFVGAFAGSWMLAHFGDGSFKVIVPWLIIFASLLMAFNRPLKAWIDRHADKQISGNTAVFSVGNFLFGMYSGYFGAGHGFLFFGFLSFFYQQGLKALNALRQVVVTAAHIASAIFFVFGTSLIDWTTVAFIFAGSVIGGFLGGRFAEKADTAKLKKFIVAFGLCFGLYLLAKNLGWIRPL